MQTDLATLESAISEQRAKLDRWLDESYGPELPREYNAEHDCSYDYWHEIGAIVGNVFDARLTKTLSAQSLDSLLFFISRDEEAGAIITWMGRRGGFSSVGDLTVDDFLYLCNESLSRPEDFVDYQLVTCFHQFTALDQCHTDTVLRFFARDYAYTKRMAIGVLAEKGFDDIPELAAQLWSHDDCEFTKLSALYALKESASNTATFAEYLAEFKTMFDVDNVDYLQTHMERLSS